MSEWSTDDTELIWDTTFNEDNGAADNRTLEDHDDEDNDISQTVKNATELKLNNQEDKERRKYLITKTIVLGLVWLTRGCYSGLTVATIPDLKLRVGSDYEEFSRALAAGSLGVFISAPLGGVLADRWVRGRDGQMITFMVFAAFFTVVRPWITDLWMFGAVMWLDGFVNGIYAPGKNNMLDKLWGSGIGLPRHLMSVCWITGNVIAPLICRPFFLINDVTNGGVDCNNSNDSRCLTSATKWLNHSHVPNGTNLHTTNVSFQNMNDKEHVVSNGTITTDNAEIRSPIEYPYIIIVTWTLVPIILLSLFYYHDPTSGQKYYTQNGEILKGDFKEVTPTWRSIFSPKTCGQGSSVFGMAIIFVLCLYYFCLSFKGRPFHEFIMAYAVDKIGMAKADAAVIMVVGRIVSIAAGIIWGTLTRFFPIQILLFIQIFTELAVVIYFNYVEIHTSGQLYGFIAAMSVLSAPNWATGITWGLRYLEFSSLVYTFIELSASSAGILSTWASGYVLEYGGHEAMLRLQLGGNAVLCIVVIIMQVVASCKGEKFKKKHETLEMKEMGANSDAKTPLLLCQ